MSRTLLVLGADVVIGPPLHREPDFVEGLIIADAGGLIRPGIVRYGRALADWERRLNQLVLSVKQFADVEVAVLADGSAEHRAAALAMQWPLTQAAGAPPQFIGLRDEPNPDAYASALQWRYGDQPEFKRLIILMRWTEEEADDAAARLAYKMDGARTTIIKLDHALGLLEIHAYAALGAVLPRGVNAARVSLDDAHPDPL